MTGPSSNYRPAFLDHFDKASGSGKKAADAPEQVAIIRTLNKIRRDEARLRIMSKNVSLSCGEKIN
jgi:hypothetical protein